MTVKDMCNRVQPVYLFGRTRIVTQPSFTIMIMMTVLLPNDIAV